MRALAIALLLAGGLPAIPSGLLAPPPALAGAAATAEPTASPEIQAAILEVARAQDEAELAAALARLRRLAGPDFAALVPQLALFLLDAKGEREGMAPAVIVSRLGITPAQVRSALEPYRDSASPALRAQIENLRGE